MISRNAFDKLVEHNFLSSSTAEELSQATDHFTRYYILKGNLETIINEIRKFQIDQPMGIVWNEEQYIHGGKFSMKTLKYTCNTDPEIEFTLEELEFYYKLIHLLTSLAT